MYRKTLFTKFAREVARLSGHPITFISSLLIILAWAITGLLFHFSDTWQLVINTGTTIVTFLMVFLIQNTQNRDTDAVQLKLDELIRAVEGAHNIFLDIEELEDAELAKIRKAYEKLAHKARLDLKKGKSDTDSPFVKLYKLAS